MSRLPNNLILSAVLLAVVLIFSMDHHAIAEARSENGAIDSCAFHEPLTRLSDHPWRFEKAGDYADFLTRFYEVTASRHLTPLEALARQYERGLVAAQHGVDDGRFVHDVTAVYHTAIHAPLLLQLVAYDDLQTDRDTMFGDVAVILLWATTPTSERKVLELRWFDAAHRTRHVLYWRHCMAGSVPMVVNSVY